MSRYIDADALYMDVIHSYDYCDDFLEMIETAPTADVRENVRGEWELAEDGWFCTACELYTPFDCDPEEKGIPYCPWCGADMRKEVE